MMLLVLPPAGVHPSIWSLAATLIYVCMFEQCNQMMISDVKRCLLKNLSIIKAKEIIADKVSIFENNWDLFITDLRSDIHSKNS